MRSVKRYMDAPVGGCKHAAAPIHWLHSARQQDDKDAQSTIPQAAASSGASISPLPVTQALTGRTTASHEPLCGGQFVEGLDCNQRPTHEHTAHTKIIPSCNGVRQERGRIAIPVFHYYLLLGISRKLKASVKLMATCGFLR
jgi:hypothetical protein